MFSHLKRRIGVLTAVAVLAALVPTLAVSTASAAPLVTAAAPAFPSTYSACPGSANIPSAGFTDTTSTDVDCIAYYGITTGVTATTYEPTASVPRWQMALYLTRTATETGITLGSGADQGFTDISGKSAEIQTAINQLKQLGVTNGTTATTYSPDDNVTREQMAMFVERQLALTAIGANGAAVSSPDTLTTNISLDGTDADAYNYTDIDGTVTFEGHNAIEELYNLGVPDHDKTVTTFSPNADITRADMATWLTNALGHSNLRPAGINIQLSKTSGWGNTAPDAVVSYRDANFDAVSGQVVDAFYWVNSTAVANNAYVNSSGQCKTNTNVLLVGNSLTRCYLDVGDPSTNSLGNIDFGQVTVANAKTTSFWAWTAASGTTYDTDTDYGTDVSTVNGTSTAQAGRITVTCDVSAYAGTTADAAPFYDTAVVRHGDTITITMQMTAATLNNGGYSSVAQPDNSITVTHAISQPNTAVLSSVTNTVVTTDSSGTATYSFTQSDPNVGGTVDGDDATDDVSHYISVADLTTQNATTGIQTVTDISSADDKPCDMTNAGSSMSFDFQDDILSAGDASQDSVSQNTTSYLAGSATAPVARTATATLRDQFGDAVPNATGTANFSGGASDALIIVAAIGSNEIDTGGIITNTFPVGTAVCFTNLVGGITGIAIDTVYYVQALVAGASGGVGTEHAFTVSATSGGAAITLGGDSAVLDAVARAHPTMGCATRSFGPAGTAAVAWNDTPATAGLDSMTVITSQGASAAGESGTTAIRYVAPSTTAIAGVHSTNTWTETNTAGAGADDDGDIIGTPVEHDTAGDSFITKLNYGDGGTETQATAVLSAGNLIEFDGTLAAITALYPLNSAVCMGDVTSITGMTTDTVYYVKSLANGSSEATDTDIGFSATLTAGAAGAALVVSGTPTVAAKIQPAVITSTGTAQCGNDTYVKYSYDSGDVFYLNSTAGVSTTPTTMAGFEGTYYASSSGTYGLQGHKADTTAGVGSPGVGWTAGDIDAVDYEALSGNISIFKSGT